MRAKLTVERTGYDPVPMFPAVEQITFKVNYSLMFVINNRLLVRRAYYPYPRYIIEIGNYQWLCPIF